jgi:F-type H+-transporting ATPase subunit delta
MMIQTSAKTYANSLIKVSEDYDKILKNLEILMDIIKYSQDFSNVIANHSIATKTKTEIIDEVFKNQVDEVVVNFLKIITEKGRFNELEQIVQAYKDEVDNIRNIKRVEVISVVELSEEQKQRLIEKLEKRIKAKVLVNWEKNEDIIGGLVVKFDDNVIDTSLKNKLEKLSNRGKIYGTY